MKIDLKINEKGISLNHFELEMKKGKKGTGKQCCCTIIWYAKTFKI